MRMYDKWGQIQNSKGYIILEHFLFGRQKYKCDIIQTVNDADKIGVVVKGNEFYVYKRRIVDFCARGNTYVVEDDALRIRVICK